MSWLTDIASGGLTAVIGGVREIVDELNLSDEERIKAEIEHKKLDVELEKAYLADVGNARHMQEIALQQDDKFAKRFVYIFALVWSLFAVIYFACVTFIELPATGIRMADTILGVLVGTVLSGFFNYFYGSSARSAKKDDVIQSLTKGSK